MRCTLFQRLACLARPLLLTALVFGLALPLAHAQGSNPSVNATMLTVREVAVTLLRGGMAIATMIALFKVTRSLLSGNPASLSSIMWLVGGLLVFFLWGQFFQSIGGTWAATSGGAGDIGNANLNQGVSTGAFLMAQKILETMLTTVVPLLMATTVILTVVRGFISSGHVQFELVPIFRVIFMYLMLVNYNNFVPLVGDLIGGLADQIQNQTGGNSTSAYTVLKQLREAAADKPAQPVSTPPNPQQAGTGTTDEPGLLAGFAQNIGQELKDGLASFSPRAIITGLATDFITSIIQAIMEFIQSFLLGFLYVAGPIALAFSLLPGFGGLAKSWLQSLISVHMWSIAFQVINGLFHYYQAADSALQYSSTSQAIQTVTGIAQTKFTVGCIVFIIMYIMVPYMTSLIVGSSGADGFVGSALRIASTVASAAATGGTAAIGTVGAGAQAANAVGAGQSLTSRMGNFTHGMGSHVASAMGMGEGGSMQQIGQMLAGGPPPPPPMPAAAASSQVQPPRFQKQSAPVPATAAPSPSGGGVTIPTATASAASGGSVAASPVAAPAVMPGIPAAHQAAASGGAAGGFNRNPAARPATSAPRNVPVAPPAAHSGQAPPPLMGG